MGIGFGLGWARAGALVWAWDGALVLVRVGIRVGARHSLGMYGNMSCRQTRLRIFKEGVGVVTADTMRKGEGARCSAFWRSGRAHSTSALFSH